MTEEFNLDESFLEECKQNGVRIEDVEYWCNEGTRYEFRKYDDLYRAARIYMDCAAKDPDGIYYKMKVCADAEEHRYFLWSLYPDD